MAQACACRAVDARDCFLDRHPARRRYSGDDPDEGLYGAAMAMECECYCHEMCEDEARERWEEERLGGKE